MKKYDVVVIGSGPGGQVSSRALAAGGRKVAVVEEDLWGGTCPNRGCDPKKVLVAGMEAVDRSNQLDGKGLSPIRSINWPGLMEFKRTFTDPVSSSSKEGLARRGITTVGGSAKFVGSGQIEVNGQAIKADTFIIATGRRPAVLDIEGKEYLKNSADFLEMETLPRKITFIGAGYIAFELACIANAAGSEVTVIHHNARPLKGFDEALVSAMVLAMRAKGIRFVFDVDIARVSRQGGSFLLEADNYEDKTDCVVCATGRLPNLETLGLENAGVEYGRRGVEVNGFLQTSNPSIYACGDVVAKKQPGLTPVARFEAKYIAQRLLGGETGSIVYPPVPSIVFGSPKLASVGVSTADAGKEPQKYTVKEVDMTRWFNYRRINEPVAKAKLVYGDGLLVGAHILSGTADELVDYLAMVIALKISKQQLSKMVFGFPTIAADLQSLLR